MPHTEARFMIKMDSLVRFSSETMSLDIDGTGGRTLLRALFWQAEDGRRCLGIASVNCEDVPRVVVSTPTPESADQQTLEVRGTNNYFYGVVESSASVIGCVLKHRDQRVMMLEEGDPADLRMTAYAIDGSPLAAAGRWVSSTQRAGGDDWRITVKPGVDAVLIIACMLSKLLLRPVVGDARPAPMSAALKAGARSPSAPG